MRTARTCGRRRAQAGFTLLETLVAIVIFSIGLLGVVGLQARSIQFSVDGEDRNRAALMADGVAAALWARDEPTADLTAADRTALAADAVGGPQGATAAVGAPSADGVVEIRITWRPPSRPATEPDSVYVTNVFIPPQ
jgi:type IV pilus assembly protein PilV